MKIRTTLKKSHDIIRLFNIDIWDLVSRPRAHITRPIDFIRETNLIDLQKRIIDGVSRKIIPPLFIKDEQYIHRP